MKIKDILDMEKTNLSGITLLKEGMFYRAYNRSAMRMSTKVRALKVNIKLIKYVGQTVMYCGFPDSILPEIRSLCAQKNYGWNACGETRIDIEGVATPDEDYEGWAQGVLKRLAVVDVPGKIETNPSLDSSVVKKYYDLVLWFLPKLADFSKEQRDVLADRIGELLLEILGLLTEAVYSVDQAKDLKAVNVRLEQLRYLVRIAKDMKYISIDHDDYFATKIDEIGRMLIPTEFYTFCK